MTELERVTRDKAGVWSMEETRDTNAPNPVSITDKEQELMQAVSELTAERNGLRLQLDEVTRERDVLARKIAGDFSSNERRFGSLPAKEWTPNFWLEWARQVVREEEEGTI